MQPYFMPYIGYFQLIASVDKFVIFDDVSYINKGWINRNRILVNGAPHTFTLPLQGASQNKRICDIELLDDPKWREKLLRTLQQAYGKAENYIAAYELLNRIITYPSIKLDEYLFNSLRETCEYLGLKTHLIHTSRLYNNADRKGQERIMDICRQEKATDYINPSGGIELYDSESFLACNVNLHFLQPLLIPYNQHLLTPVLGLSIIDVLMHNSRFDARELVFQRNHQDMSI